MLFHYCLILNSHSCNKKFLSSIFHIVYLSSINFRVWALIYFNFFSWFHRLGSGVEKFGWIFGHIWRPHQFKLRYCSQYDPCECQPSAFQLSILSTFFLFSVSFLTFSKKISPLFYLVSNLFVLRRIIYSCSFLVHF